MINLTNIYVYQANNSTFNKYIDMDTLYYYLCWQYTNISKCNRRVQCFPTIVHVVCSDNNNNK